MIVVSDTSPLNYLVLIDEVHVLLKLFKTVYVPSIVLMEMSHANAPALVRGWANAPPSWLIVLDPSHRASSTAKLDLGEAAAISLALELKISTLLIDERRGTKIALEQGLIPLPTVALLARAAADGLIDLPVTIQKLRKTSIRVSEDIINAALKRDLLRRKQNP